MIDHRFKVWFGLTIAIESETERRGYDAGNISTVHRIMSESCFNG
jgi:hypothetical protein